MRHFILDAICGICSNFLATHCVKNRDNTRLRVPWRHKWKRHFRRRFRDEDSYTDLVLKTTLPFIESGTFVLDTNANLGEIGLYLGYHLQRSYPERRIAVIMIEPDPSKTEVIREMIKLNKLSNCMVITCGISDRESTDCRFTSSPIYTIDKLFGNVNISLIHIDVDGTEYKLLKEAETTLKRVEYILINMRNNPCNREHERWILNRNGFVDTKHQGILNKELYVRLKQKPHNTKT